MKRPLVVPEELHRNAPDVHALGPENTGTVLLHYLAERIGVADLSQSDILDVGCGVRFAQTMINRDIPVRSYAGIDVHRPLIEFLQREIDDPRFTFRHWDTHNARYNPTGVVMTPDSALPIDGTFSVICLFSVFTHLDAADASALFAILRRYVRSDGALFFSAFIDDTVNDFEDRMPDYPLSHPCYTERYLRQLAESNRWRVESVMPPSPEHFIQHSVLCRPV